MKKNFLYIVYVLSAQSHSFRDTNYVRYEQFDFDAWMWADTVHHGKSVDEYPIYDHSNTFWDLDIVQYNYTDNSAGMEIVGLSAAVVLQHGYISANVPPEYLLLYDALTDAFDLKAQVRWFEDDTVGRPAGRYMENPILCHDSNTSHNGPFYYGYVNNTHVIKIFDIYFDKPITVYDSFYVGATHNFFSEMFTPESIISSSTYIYFNSTYRQYDTTCLTPSLWKLYFHRSDNVMGAPSLQWVWFPTNQFLVVLPIIKVVDTSFANAPECPRVSGMFLRGNYTDTVTVQWAYDTLHDEFEVSYGRVGTAPDEGTVVTVRDNKWQFADSAYNDTQMVVYVRTVCREYDTLRWSSWSVPMYMCVHYDVDTAQQEGIEVPEEVSDLQRFVRMMPNPASRSVIVMSSYGMERVEVYDARGGKVYDSPAKGTSTGFDVSSWAKGTYVVLVRTPAGTAAKRLVVN